MATSEKLPKEGLSVLYRIGWQIRKAVMTVFGPAQLGTLSDPIERLKTERRGRSAAAVAAKKRDAGDR